MKKGNTHNWFRTGLLASLVCAVVLSSCVNEDVSDCPAIMVKVVLANPDVPEGSDGADRDDLQDSTVERVSLYIFDENKELVDMRETAVGRIEPIAYPNVESFHFVALGNVAGNCQSSSLSVGDNVSSGSVNVRKSESPFCGIDLHEYPAELFWGNKDVLNDGSETGVIEVPVIRMVAGVYVRVVGLKDHMESKGVTGDDYADDKFSVVLGCGYNKLNFLGEPCCEVTRAASDAVNHISKGKTRTLKTGSEMFDLPGQSENAEESPKYFPVIATYDGMPVSVELFHDETSVTNVITTTMGGGQLAIYNNKLNIIDIIFKGDGSVVVKVSQVAWNEAVEIEVEF